MGSPGTPNYTLFIYTGRYKYVCDLDDVNINMHVYIHTHIVYFHIVTHRQYVCTNVFCISIYT